MEASHSLIETEAWRQLDTVCDPEIDTVTIIDLGMVDKVLVSDNKVSVDLLPTFLGCPALGIIKENVIKAIKLIDEVKEVEVNYIKNPPWTSDRITSKGREGLKVYGIAPPPLKLENDGTWKVECPYCGSPYHSVENIFGPSACRSILYCKNCKNPYEAMKPISTMN
ncbi:1,2-phenylacetyl-CoA epoxidase subunit PaaD [Calidifontibacillus oryziterrae]|uniref:1,2-phenylacetyl-CoA epoxidase subunit PaaD n=1 Tax=Calidifontibacillus oryziterrae TaxID=1191699 RepID=UPI0002FFD1B9|nr:1,2-phenylacetyl-CoA epoxidase subunit PaaD [Calidifontibacillus oryziterrae]